MAHNPHLEDAKKNAASFEELKFNTGTVFLRWFLLSPKSLVDFQISVDTFPTYCPNFDSEFCSVFQFSRSVVSDSLRPHARQHARSITNSWSLPKPMSIESVMPSNHLILCCPLLLLPSIFPSIRVFSHELAFRIRWPKYCSFSFNISPTSEQPGLISFRMDWLDLLAVQGTLKNLLQHQVQKHQFFGAQLSL